MGKLSVTEAQQLAACRGDGSQGIALLLDVSSWADEALRASSQQAMSAPDGAAAGDGQAAGSAPPAGSRATDGLTTGSPTTGGTAEASPITPQVPADGTALTARGSAGRPASAETKAAAAVLRSAGWHVTSIDASTPLAVAWQRLPRAAEMLVAAAGRPGGSPA